MSLTAQQLQTLQDDLDAVKAAAIADASADQAVADATTALTLANTTKAATAPALVATEQKMVADAQADFNPPAP